MILREMKLDDLDAVLEIENEAFSDHWPRTAYEYEISENEFSTAFVAVDGEQIVGAAVSYLIFDDAQIATIAVRKSHQGQGIGSLMMDKIVQDADAAGCSTLSLEVRISNTPAIKLYEKYGFINVNIRKGYYADGEDAFLMIKPLGGQTAWVD